MVDDVKRGDTKEPTNRLVIGAAGNYSSLRDLPIDGISYCRILFNRVLFRI